MENKEHKSMEAIDFVVPWVDGNDPEWRKKRDHYAVPDDKEGNRPERFRDWELFHYWFRAVEENAPWVRCIYLVTDHQTPHFLYTDHPKLKIVFHEQFIPEKYLPTFSSHTIELNMHRLPGLSEFFVYFNDDMFLNRPMKEKDFFRRGKPCYSMIERPLEIGYPVSMMQSVVLSDMGVVNRHFQRKDSLRRLWLYASLRYGKWFLKNLLMLPFHTYQHFEDHHMPCPFLKSTLKEVWQAEEAVLDETCRHRFRTYGDVNQYLFRYWDIARGNFAPWYRQCDYYSVKPENISQCVHSIVKGEHPMLCLNDGGEEAQFDALCAALQKAFLARYPKPSSFEK